MCVCFRNHRVTRCLCNCQIFTQNKFASGFVQAYTQTYWQIQTNNTHKGMCPVSWYRTLSPSVVVLQVNAVEICCLILTDNWCSLRLTMADRTTGAAGGCCWLRIDIWVHFGDIFGIVWALFCGSGPPR